MLKPKMGGKSNLRILLKGDEDVTNSLLSLSEGGKKLNKGLRDLIQEKYQGAFQVEIISEPGERSDILVQKINQVPIPDVLKLPGIEPEKSWHKQSCLFDQNQNLDVIVFSLQPEIIHSLSKHRQTGYLLNPPDDWPRRWTEAQQQDFKEQFESVGLLPVQQSQENLSQIINYVKEKVGAYIIFYNCCTIDPNDEVYNYYQQEEPLSLRIKQFNLALMKLSILAGISIVDVDYQLAALGAERHIPKVLDYSLEAQEAICQEFLRVIEDVGFFEKRSLLMQVGQQKK